MAAIKENIHCFQYMFFFIFLIYSFIYFRVLSKYLPDEDEVSFLRKAMDYWKKKPIWKFLPLRIDAEDPKDMEKYSFGEWPGTYDGCNCSFSYNNYYVGSCSNERLNNKCNNVKGEDSKKIYNYFFKYFVTYYDADYLTLLTRIEKKYNNSLVYECKNGYKRCGDLDNTFIHPFCVKESEDCVMNYIYFERNSDRITIYYGFNESYIHRNIAINNLFVGDEKHCIINENYFYDNFELFKNKTDTFSKCRPRYSQNIYYTISNSGTNKYYLYGINDIYNGYSKYPFTNHDAYMYSMIYYGISGEVKEYYNSDIFFFQNLNLFNILIFIIFKAGIQLGYFIFINKALFRNKRKEIMYNIIWACVFIAYLIFIWLFNNSVYRSSILIAQEIETESGKYKDDKEANLTDVIKNLRIADIIMAFIIIVAHITKLVNIMNKENIKKYAEFINVDK